MTTGATGGASAGEPDGGERRVLVAGLPEEVAGWLGEELDAVRVRAVDGFAATLAALGAERWDLLLLDHRLDGGTGLELLRRVRGEAAAASIPVVFCLLPERAGDLPRELVQELGVSQLLVHPLDRRELIGHVDALLPAAPERPRQERAAAAAAAMAALWSRYREPMLARVDTLEEAVVALLEGALDPERRRDAERNAHKIAGSAGTFGFPEASRLAREIEGVLEGDRPLEPSRVLHLADQVARLRTELEREPESAAREGAAGGAGPEAAEPPVLLILEPDPAVGESLARATAARGFAPRVASTAAEARRILLEGQPALAVLDFTPTLGGRALLRELGATSPSVPTVVLTAGGSFVDRVEATRLGARLFLPKSVTPEHLAGEVHALWQRARPPRSRVLVVDDDPQVLAAVQALLEPRGLEVSTLGDPLAFWERLEAVAPDLLILDVDMPYLNGVELCRVVRSAPRWESLPVLVLTGNTGSDVVQRVFAAGADDYVAKPFVGPELWTRIRNRLERAQLLRHLADTDHLTGVANRRRAGEQLEQLRRLAQRHGERLCVALVDVDAFKRINDRHGHPTGDAVLIRLAERLHDSLRGEDVVGRWGGEEFVLGMYGMSRDDGIARVGQILGAFGEERFVDADGRPFQVTFSGGVAEFPEDGNDLPTLLGAADAALYAAKEAGRARVRGAGAAGADAAAGPLDILLVDDDEALAALVRHTLETQGYRTEWIQSGRAALEALTREEDRLRARVLLLDVDLPGLDGLSLLRRLQGEGITRSTRVIMLTARSSEGEVVRALRLGAVDHIAKPFSLAVMVERVRHALEG